MKKILTTLLKDVGVVVTGLVSLTQFPDWETALLLTGCLVLFLHFQDEMKVLRLSKQDCVEELHERDKLLAVLFFHLQVRSGGGRAPAPSLDDIVGPKVAKAVRDAAIFLNLGGSI